MSKKNLLLTAEIFYALSVFPLAAALYHLWFYQAPDSIGTGAINAYVGGDAYNYIINASKSNANFLLAIYLLLIAVACTISSAVLQKSIKKTVQSDDSKTESPNK